jgi:imidazole glycerol-phosphate synthase subunit HisF
MSKENKKNIRFIPRLDIKGPNLVKGIHLEGLKILGDPNTFAKHYYDSGADELLYMDSVASLYGRNSLSEIIEKTVKEIFIPFTVGGGIRNLDDIYRILRKGADKVAINTEALINPNLITESAKKFGSSTIMIEIQTQKQLNNKYYAFMDNGRTNSNIEAIDWAKKVEDLGAGEILITSINKDGTGQGFDLDIVTEIASKVSIPIIASGGAGEINHIKDLAEKSQINGIGLASILHYDFVKKMLNDHYKVKNEGKFEIVGDNFDNKRIQTTNIKIIKDMLIKNGFICRPID